MVLILKHISFEVPIFRDREIIGHLSHPEIVKIKFSYMVGHTLYRPFLLFLT